MITILEINKVHQGDCLELMKDIPDKSIDFVLCDLPYGTTKNKWDSIIPLEPLWEQYERIIKDNGAIALTAQTPFDKVLGVSNLKLLRYEWIWEKDRATGHLNAKKMPMKAHENVLIFYKKIPVYNPQKTIGHKPVNTSSGRMNTNNNYGEYKAISSGGHTDRFPRSIQKFNVVNSNSKEYQEHGAQKPIKLFEYLIKTYTNEGMTVLDNASGSSTTAIACINTNRNYICIEKEIDYVDMSNERIDSHINQL